MKEIVESNIINPNLLNIFNVKKTVSNIKIMEYLAMAYGLIFFYRKTIILQRF